MRAFYILMVILIVVGCRKTGPDFYSCADKAGLFTWSEPFVVSLDSIHNYKAFREIYNNISDTLNNCILPCGIIYNYKDSTFIPNPDSNYNIVVAAFSIVSKRCHADRAKPKMEIYLNSSDTIELISELKKTHLNINGANREFKQEMDDYFKALYNPTNFLGGYIHLVIPDSLDFNDHLLPCFKVILDSYKSVIEDYTKVQESCLCDTSIYARGKEITMHLRFGIMIDDLDFRKWEELMNRK